MIELRQQLDKERSVRMMLEEQVRMCFLWVGEGTLPWGSRSAWSTGRTGTGLLHSGLDVQSVSECPH